MKRKLRTLICATASALAFSALAQDTPNIKTEQPDYARGRATSTARADQLNDAAKASDIIGMTVKNNQDEKLGKVEDLAVDLESGRIVQVILSTGGFIGIGDKLTAVPPGAFHRDASHKVLHLDADKEKLKAAPKFEMSNWAENCDCNHLTEVYRNYGQENAFKFVHKGDAIREQPRIESTPNAVPDVASDRSVTRESRFMIPESRLANLQKASKLMGTSVKNLQDEKLGKVDNILLDLPSGRLVAVIVSSGGFLGMGDELSAVPPTALRFSGERENLQLDATKEMLSSAPHFKANQWPDFAEPTYAEGVYRAYRVEPYFTTNATSEADNTVRNVRDRNDRTLTPFDQGHSPADRETTAQIRKEILDVKGMSVNGRNVKIITTDGQVTLRGTVNTPEEKTSIEAIAKRVARSENVNNQLEVKLPPTGRE